MAFALTVDIKIEGLAGGGRMGVEVWGQGINNEGGVMRLVFRFSFEHTIGLH